MGGPDSKDQSRVNARIGKKGNALACQPDRREMPLPPNKLNGSVTSPSDAVNTALTPSSQSLGRRAPNANDTPSPQEDSG